MKKNVLALFIGLIILVGGISFYGGMKFSQSSNPAVFRGNGNGFGNLSDQDRQARFQQLAGGNIGGVGRASGATGGFINGEIISQDDESITMKLRDGGSKIIFYSATTQISQLTEATSSDLAIGKTVMASGSANSDGSITAQSLQIRPAVVNQE